MKVILFGGGPICSIFQNNDSACFPHPFNNMPVIMVFHVITFVLRISLKTENAFPTCPHFPYMSTRAVPKFRSTSNICSSI
ncbi:hypothetical protein ACHQM5_011353 [Ranunculus cassubicifolius]